MLVCRLEQLYYSSLLPQVFVHWCLCPGTQLRCPISSSTQTRRPTPGISSMCCQVLREDVCECVQLLMVIPVVTLECESSYGEVGSRTGLDPNTDDQRTAGFQRTYCLTNKRCNAGIQIKEDKWNQTAWQGNKYWWNTQINLEDDSEPTEGCDRDRGGTGTWTNDVPRHSW